MKTIIVPVDFTSTTENAVRTAAEWAKEYEYTHMILLKTAEESEFDYLHIAEGHSFANEESINTLLEKTKALLKKLNDIVSERNPEVEISQEFSSWPVTRSINEILKENPSVELIILGSDDKAYSSDSFVSENIIRIARTSRVKTLIVPNGYEYGTIKEILIPCDIHGIAKLDRLFHHKSLIHKKDVQLNLLNVQTKENDHISTEKRKELEAYIRENLTEIPNKIYYSYDKNVISGILNFAASHKTDLIIALPGRHSFLYYVTNRSISEGIYQNVNQPVMILK